jgi:hypothetical protein
MNSAFNYNLSNNKVYGDRLLPDDRPIQDRFAQYKLAKYLGGSGMHGDSGDYVDLGNMKFDAYTGHGGDAGKLPWHPTFSNQSAFSTNFVNGEPIFGMAEGGKWTSDNRGDTFYPSQWQMSRPGYQRELQRYFDNERGRGIDNIVVPPPYENNFR